MSSRTTAASTSRGCARASSRSSSRRLHTGSATAWCAPPTVRTCTATAAARSSEWSSIPPAMASWIPIDLRGGARAPRRFIGWQTFFDFGDGNVKPNKRIDTKISTPLFNLPLGAIPSHDHAGGVAATEPSAPADLEPALGAGGRRGDGRHAARGRRPHRAPSLRLPVEHAARYYVLKEAELVEDGLHLGPVGGRIVGEVLIGLLQSDTGSYLVRKPTWTPTLTSAGASFRMKDFLTFAGVDPASRGHSDARAYTAQRRHLSHFHQCATRERSP